jgi:hypothetical protein
VQAAYSDDDESEVAAEADDKKPQASHINFWADFEASKANPKAEVCLAFSSSQTLRI